MRRDEVVELHYIAPIANMPSILEKGILSHNAAAKIPHHSVAMPEIQDIRKRRRVPGTHWMLHDYVNLYFDARNPMLYKRRQDHAQLCILQVDSDVLELPGVIISDGNASSQYTRFARSPEGLDIVNANLTFAKYWHVPNDEFGYWSRKSAKCAEVLVPRSVVPRFIEGVYVSCDKAKDVIHNFQPALNVILRPYLFFR